MGAFPCRRAAALAVGMFVWLIASLNGAGAAGAEGGGVPLPEYKPDAIPHSQYRTPPIADRDSADASAALSPALMSDGSRLPEYFLAIFSGSTEGSYFRVASTICDVMTLRFAEHRIRCVPLRSQGTGSNRELMRQGRVQVMLVQSDTNWQAATGVEPIAAARSVASVHDELGLLVARRSAGIRTVSDLRGKRISAGTAGSGARRLWTELLQAMDLTEGDFRTIFDLSQGYYHEGVCRNYMDAFGVWIGHPAPLVGRALQACDLTLAGMDGPWVDRLLAEKPYYIRGDIPAGTYAGQETDLTSYGPKAVLVADVRANEYVIYWLTRILVENVADLRARTSILATLDPEAMFRDGNFLPFHAGAERYWRELGYLPEPTPTN